MERLYMVIAFVLVFGFVGIVAGCVVALVLSMFAGGSATWPDEGRENRGGHYPPNPRLEWRPPSPQGSNPNGMQVVCPSCDGAFDPCLSCSTHALGQMPLQIRLLGPGGELLDEKRR